MEVDVVDPQHLAGALFPAALAVSLAEELERRLEGPEAEVLLLLGGSAILGRRSVAGIRRIHRHHFIDGMGRMPDKSVRSSWNGKTAAG